MLRADGMHEVRIMNSDALRRLLRDVQRPDGRTVESDAQPCVLDDDGLWIAEPQADGRVASVREYERFARHHGALDGLEWPKHWRSTAK